MEKTGLHGRQSKKAPVGILLLIMVRNPSSVLHEDVWRIKPLFYAHYCFFFSRAWSSLLSQKRRHVQRGTISLMEYVATNAFLVRCQHTWHTFACELLESLHIQNLVLCSCLQVISLWRVVAFRAIEVIARLVLLMNTKTRWIITGTADNAEPAQVEQLYLFLFFHGRVDCNISNFSFLFSPILVTFLQHVTMRLRYHHVQQRATLFVAVWTVITKLEWTRKKMSVADVKQNVKQMRF